MNITNDIYRTKSGRFEFEFNFVELSSFIEVDIVMQPGYGERSSDAHSTHRLTSDRGGNKICFAEPSSVKRITKAFEYAEAWAESTEQYILIGNTF